MGYFNQKEFSIPLSAFNADDAFKRFEKMVLTKVEIKNMLKDNLDSVQTKALENINLLSKYN